MNKDLQEASRLLELLKKDIKRARLRLKEVNKLARPYRYDVVRPHAWRLLEGYMYELEYAENLICGKESALPEFFS